MLSQQFLRLQNQLVDQIHCFLGFRYLCLNQQRTPFLIGMIVGWGTDNVFVAPLDNQQVTILDASDEFYSLTSLPFVDGLGEVFVQVIDEHTSIFCL